jgi:hypothetical protein
MMGPMYQGIEPLLVLTEASMTVMREAANAAKIDILKLEHQLSDRIRGTSCPYKAQPLPGHITFKHVPGNM